MLYVEPTSQYKFVAKPAPPAESTDVTDATPTTAPIATANATNIPSQTNNATHFQAAEHVQNKTLNRQSSANAALGLTYDGKRMRKAVQRRTVDYNSSVIRLLETRKWFKSSRNQYGIQPQEIYNIDVVPPAGYIKNPMNAVTTKFVRTSTNKLRCPIFCVVWTPEGRRLVTGASSGEFTLWNGLTFNFETILQAHDRAVRSMVWSHHDVWLLTGDHGGFVKYWQSNMNNVKMYEAHKEPIRGLSFSPSDSKYASCSDDGLVKVWDFYRCVEERQLKGHGADVKCVDWHPSKGLLVSGSKDSQQPVKLWDPKTGNSITTLHCHKSTVMTAKWNSNGNWLLTGSRDHLLKVFDIRAMKELQTFRGHKKEATAVAWHPVHETLFASGGSDGSIMFWLTGVDEKAGAMDKAHEGIVWSLAWHPVGHILCSGSNDHTSKFWTRNRPGDTMHDRYNLDICHPDEAEYSEEGFSSSVLPGLSHSNAIIPGVGLPITASNVVLPDSNDTDEDTHLYGKAVTASPISSTKIPPVSLSTAQLASSDSVTRPGILGRYPPGMPAIPGLGGADSSSSGPTMGPEGIRDAGNTMNQPRGLHPGPPRSDAGPPRPGFDRNERMSHNQAQFRPQQRPPFAQPGNYPQFNPGPVPGLDFPPRSGPGNRDSNMNFRPSGPFPPNQFMRFPGPPGGPIRDPNFDVRPTNEHPHELRPRGPRPPGFRPPQSDLRHTDQRDHENTGDEKDKRGPPVTQERNLDPRPPRSANRRDSDPTAPGILGDYETHQREFEHRLRTRTQLPGEGQTFHRNSFENSEGKPYPGVPDGPQHGPGHSFGRPNPNSRGGPAFEPREERERLYERTDRRRSEERAPHGRPDMGRPGEGPAFEPREERERLYDRSDRRRPEERAPHGRPDMGRPGEGPPQDRPDMGRSGEGPSHERPDVGRPREGAPHGRPDVGRPGERSPHGRQDSRRPGEVPPHGRKDMGRPGGPSQERPDIGRTREGPSHGRPDMGRSGEGQPYGRPDIGRPGDGLPHGRPDIGRPGERPSHDRPDMGRHGDRGMIGRPDTFHAGGPRHDRPDAGRPDDQFFRKRPDRPDEPHMRDRPGGPPHDTRSFEGVNHRPARGPPAMTGSSDSQLFDSHMGSRQDNPSNRMNFDRSPRDRVPPERQEKEAADRPERRDSTSKPAETGNIMPLMSLMTPRPSSGQDHSAGNQQGSGTRDVENRGRKRSIDNEFDRAPKRMEPSDRVW